jgi:hypothetical protein
MAFLVRVDAHASPETRRGPETLPTAMPEAFAGLFGGYATAVAKPGGPLDGDMSGPRRSTAATPVRSTI